MSIKLILKKVCLDQPPFVRIDILEKLFLKILNNTKNKKFKINSEMMNLLGCTKESF